MKYLFRIKPIILGRQLVKRATLPTILAASISQAVWADDDVLPERSVNGTTALIIRVETAKTELSPKWTEIEQQDASGTLKQVSSIITQPLQQVQEMLGGETVFLAVDMPYGARVDARLQASTNVPEAKFVSAAKLLWPGTMGATTQAAGWQTLPLTMANKPTAQSKDSDLFPVDAETWKTAMEETADYPVQLAIVLPEYFRKTFAEIEPDLPTMLGGGPAGPLVSGLRWVSMGIQPENLTVRIVIQTDSSATAELGKQRIPQMLQALTQAAKLDSTTSTMIMAVVGLMNPTVVDSQIIFALDNPQKSSALLQLTTTAIATAAKPMAVSQTQNNLKQLGLGMHNYYSAMKALPTYAELKKKGEKSGLSWRVHILPYIDYAELYQEFKLDEPWDSPHNIKLLDRMPEIFKPRIAIGSKETCEPFHTSYVAPLGEQTVFGRDEAIDFHDITDGTSNTICFVELKPEYAIPWTSPEEYPFDPADPASKLRIVDGRYSVAFMDGSVRSISTEEPASTWNALFTINGGELVNPQ